MKQLLMALTMIGMIHYSANAQSKKNYNQNYPVCRTGDGYAICNKAQTSASTTFGTEDMTSTTAPEDMNQSTLPLAVNPIPCNTISDNDAIGMNNVNAYEGYYTRHNIVVSYDDMTAPYQGEPARSYDGPAKNDYRNMNENQDGMSLPPSTGSNSK